MSSSAVVMPRSSKTVFRSADRNFALVGNIVSSLEALADSPNWVEATPGLRTLRAPIRCVTSTNEWSVSLSALRLAGRGEECAPIIYILKSGTQHFSQSGTEGKVVLLHNRLFSPEPAHLGITANEGHALSEEDKASRVGSSVCLN
jgi:hypothetical protein